MGTHQDGHLVHPIITIKEAVYGLGDLDYKLDDPILSEALAAHFLYSSETVITTSQHFELMRGVLRWIQASDITGSRDHE